VAEAALPKCQWHILSFQEQQKGVHKLVFWLSAGKWADPGDNSSCCGKDVAAKH